MKNSILPLVSFFFIGVSFLMSCSNSADRVDDAKQDVVKADSNLVVAQEEFLADVENYRRTTSEKVAENEKNIAEFKARVEQDKKIAKADYNLKIAELEQKNNDLRMKMENYRADSKEQWESFKIEFNHDMDEVGKAFKDLTVNNVKK